MQNIQSCLWFENNAEDAVSFYSSVFKNSKTDKIAYYGKNTAEVSGKEAGTVLTIDFILENLSLIAMNGGPQAGIKFSPAVSFFVYCDNVTELDEYWRRLRTGGDLLMELKNYPWSERYGWCKDRFGISWQLMLVKDSNISHKIAPAFLFTNDLYGKGEEAINFYTSIIPNSRVEYINRDSENGSVSYAEFILNEQKFVLMESGDPAHTLSVTPAISFVLNCDTQEEIDTYWNKLSFGGNPGQCGWLDDKFGVAWQVVPTKLAMWVSGDPKKADNVMEALLKMHKLDIQELENSYH
jgi:predicted 3-demethylubiquinone-9 3-methyltransferase (glyoxalase superfamily)